MGTKLKITDSLSAKIKYRKQIKLHVRKSVISAAFEGDGRNVERLPIGGAPPLSR